MAAPVGSVTLAKLFKVSSATIRAEMGKLEAMGYIMQPYTSAGRIPTDAGYRLYVNSLQEKFEHEDEQPRSEKRLTEGENRQTRALATRIQAQTRADYAIRAAVDSLVDLTGNLGIATVGDQLYIAGFSGLFSQPEFAQSSRVQAVGKLLDQLKPWLNEVSPNEAIHVYIGTENPVGKSSDVSLIISRFCSPYSDRSYIGVLGPTRQSYKRVMSLVRHAGLMLEEILYEGQ